MYNRINYASKDISCIFHICDDEIIKFGIQGSTIYDVIFTRKEQIWTCTCPDFLDRKKWCKHVYYVLLYLLKMELPPDNPMINTWRYGHRCNFGRKRSKWFADMANDSIVYEKYQYLCLR